MNSSTINFFRPTVRGFVGAMAAVCAGCSTPPGEIFPPLERPLVWPASQDVPRIRYVGQLATDADLKPGISGLKRMGIALFGKPPIQSMLTPYALCTDGGERLFVADSNAQVVHVFDLKTRRYLRWQPTGEKFSQPVGIAFDPTRRRLFVADSVAARVFIFDDHGKSIGSISSDVLTRPAGLAFDAASDRLFVADVAAHQVLAFDGDGKPIARIGSRGSGPGEFNYPTNVAVDSQRRLYVSDSLNFRVQQFDAELKFVRQIGKQGDMPGYFAQPKGLSVDREDHLYVVDAQFEAIQIFDVTGQLLLDFGGEGHGAGQFWIPAGIFIDEHDRIWVADAYNRRVQVFDHLKEAPQ